MEDIPIRAHGTYGIVDFYTNSDFLIRKEAAFRLKTKKDLRELKREMWRKQHSKFYFFLQHGHKLPEILNTGTYKKISNARKFPVFIPKGCGDFYCRQVGSGWTIVELRFEGYPKYEESKKGKGPLFHRYDLELTELAKKEAERKYNRNTFTWWFITVSLGALFGSTLGLLIEKLLEAPK